jgi:sugar lactone lactonase YvrE
MNITIKLGLGLAALALLGNFSFPRAAFAQSRIRFADSDQRLGVNDISGDVVLGDVNGDGKLDAVIAKTGWSRSQVWTNQGTGQFLNTGQSLGSGFTSAIALADLDADGDLDVFLCDNDPVAFRNLQIWINQGGNQAGTPGAFLFNGQTNETIGHALALGELDAVPGPDAVVGSTPGTVWFNNGNGSFRASDHTLGNPGQLILDVALANFDGTYGLDVFVVCEGTNSIWRNQGGDGAGTFQDTQNLNNGLAGAQSVALGDLDGDGDVDALVVGATNRVWLNRGGLSGTFTNSSQTFGDGSEAFHVALGDLDRDGDLDAVVTASSAIQSTTRVYENDGTARFTDTNVRLGTVSSSGGVTTAVALGDLDGDGDLDAFVARHNEPDQIWLNTTPPPGPTFPEYIITTIAGNGASGSTGDGGQATNAPLSDPWHLAVDAQGNVYVSGGGHRVRKVATNGIITTFAGTGLAGFSGDGGPATNAQLNTLSVGGGVAVDRFGNLYTADTGNHRVRRVDTNGTITTFAGSGIPGSTGDGGPALNATLDFPTFVSVDQLGNVYIATGVLPDRIRKVDTGGIITTVFDEDDRIDGITVDSSGNLFFTDSPANTVSRLVNGVKTTFAGQPELEGYRGSGGPATHALLNFPIGVATDSTCNLFIADTLNHRVRRVDTNGLISTVAGFGTDGFAGDGRVARSASLETLRGLAVDSKGNLFIATGNRVRRLSPNGFHRPLAPGYWSTAEPGTPIDFGTAVRDPDDGITYSLYIGNTGSADLRISAYLTAPSTNLSIINRDSPFLPAVVITDGDPQHFLQSSTGYAGNLEVLIKLSINIGDIGKRQETLRIVSNDPYVPVVEHPVRYEIAQIGENSFEDVILSLLRLFAPPLSLANGVDLTCPQTATFALDPGKPYSLRSEVPAFLGGGSIVLSNFTGSVTVSVHPIPNDFDRAYITIDGGIFTAPSVRLPSGLHTGQNTLTFGPASQSQGFLNLTNGEYTVSATATIVNDLIPDGVNVRGNYSGVYHEATGRASVQSQSRDSFVRSDRVQVNHLPSGLALTWTGGSGLEEATNVLGPWRTVTNAASPYAVVTTTNQQQFFRLRLPAP